MALVPGPFGTYREEPDRPVPLLPLNLTPASLPGFNRADPGLPSPAPTPTYHLGGENLLYLDRGNYQYAGLPGTPGPFGTYRTPQSEAYKRDYGPQWRETTGPTNSFFGDPLFSRLILPIATMAAGGYLGGAIGGGAAGTSATGAGLAAGGGSEIGVAGGSLAAEQIANAGMSGLLTDIPGLAVGAGAGVAASRLGAGVSDVLDTPIATGGTVGSFALNKSVSTGVSTALDKLTRPVRIPVPSTTPPMGPALTQSLAKLQATIAQLRQARTTGTPSAAGRSTFNNSGAGVTNLADLMRRRADVNRRLLALRQARAA